MAAAAFSLVSMLAIGRVIGPDAMGAGTIAIAAFLLLDVFAAALFPDALVQRRAVAARHADSAATASVAVGAAAGLALAAAGPFLAGGNASAPEVAWLALALAPLLPLSAFSGTASGLLLREQRFRLLALRLLLGQPLALAAGLLVALAGHGPWAMVANQAVNTLVTFLVMLRGGRLGLRPRLDLGALRDLWPVAGPQVAGVAVMAGKYRLFLLALGLAVSPAVLAVSHFAFRLLDAALAVVWQAVGRLSMPRLCALQHDREAMAEAYGELAQLQALLGLPIAAGIALAAPDLVRALLGPAWAGAGEAARVAAAAAMLGFLHGDCTALFVAVGKARRNAQIAVASLLLPLLALALLRPQTPEGVALTWAVPGLVLPPVLAWAVLRELQRPALWLARRIAPGVAATAAMAAAVLAVQGTALASWPPLARLLACAAVGAMAFVGVAWLALGGRLPRALAAPARTAPAVAAE